MLLAEAEKGQSRDLCFSGAHADTVESHGIPWPSVFQASSETDSSVFPVTSTKVQRPTLPEKSHLEAKLSPPYLSYCVFILVSLE